MNLIKIWKNKNNILEGIKNSIFKKEDVEEIANERINICKTLNNGLPCECYDTTGVGCEVPLTQPCCNLKKGGCGCSLKFLTHSLSESCVKGHWKSILTQEEEDLLNQKI